MLGKHSILNHTGFQVWMFAFGYFLSYIPYSALAKAMTRGYLTADHQLYSGVSILPATLLGTIITMPLLIAAYGGFHFASTRRAFGRDVPFPRGDTLISGLGFAAIIVTTTLAYSFAGISIVLALVLMRAGVLTVAPTIDLLVGRSVHRYSWIALILSFAALAVALSQIGTYQLSYAAAANLGLYLCGYVARLRTMSTRAKVVDEAVNRRFFAEECIVAMVALLAIVGIFAAVGLWQDGSWHLLTHFFGDPLLVPAVSAGIAYGFLGIFATLIYLDPLENTFAIPVFCCASLLSGIVASLALAWLYGAPPLSGADLISSGLIMLAGLCLNARAIRHGKWRPAARTAPGPRQLLLFVCSGNTSRSPIAQAICSSEIVRRLLKRPDPHGLQRVQVDSAGLTAKVGAPITHDAKQALHRLGVPMPDHVARQLTPELVDAATTIICMTNEQCDAVLAINQRAAGKVHRLHPFRDLADPTGGGPKAFLTLSRQIHYLVAQRLSYFLLETAVPDQVSVAMSAGRNEALPSCES